VVPPKIVWTVAEPPEPTIVPESSGLVVPPVKAGLRLISGSRGVRAVPSGRQSCARGSSRRGAAPSRGLGPTTTPNQRPRISQPSMRTSAPVSSSRHSCHRSSGCTRPATAARCGRAPASRRAAISTSAGVRALTMTARAHAALDDHRGGQAAVRRTGKPSKQRRLRRALRTPLRSRPVARGY